MKITCPACSTSYDVPESAIAAEGRTVRCAQCRHSWFQPGPDTEAASPDEQQPATISEAVAEPVVAAAETVTPIPEIGLIDEPAPPHRGRWRTWLIAVLLFVLLAAGIAGAIAWYGPPDWLPIARPAIDKTRTGLTLDFPRANLERKTLADGTEYFGAHGIVTNTGQTRLTVPPILVVLRDRDHMVVYSWEVIPPKRQLAPGESMTITEAVTDVPKAGTEPEIGWKAG